MLKLAFMFRKAFKNLKTKYTPYTREVRTISGAPDDEDWDKVACFLPFLELFYEATLTLSGSRYVTGIHLWKTYMIFYMKFLIILVMRMIGLGAWQDK